MLNSDGVSAHEQCTLNHESMCEVLMCIFTYKRLNCFASEQLVADSQIKLHELVCTRLFTYLPLQRVVVPSMDK
jgi:hypothetical protein